MPKDIRHVQDARSRLKKAILIAQQNWMINKALPTPTYSTISTAASLTFYQINENFASKPPQYFNLRNPSQIDTKELGRPLGNPFGVEKVDRDSKTNPYYTHELRAFALFIEYIHNNIDVLEITSRGQLVEYLRQDFYDIWVSKGWEEFCGGEEEVWLHDEVELIEGLIDYHIPEKYDTEIFGKICGSGEGDEGGKGKGKSVSRNRAPPRDEGQA